jgi:hypothetical protein
MGRDERRGGTTCLKGVAVHLEPVSDLWRFALLRISRQDAAPTVNNAMWDPAKREKMSKTRYF